MNAKQELEIIENQLDDLKKERNLFGAIDIFENVKYFNCEFDMDSSQITIDYKSKQPWILLTAIKNGKQVENSFVNVVFEKYDIEPLDTSLSYFLEALDLTHKSGVTIDKDTTLDKFINKYLASEYNSRYLYKKMLPSFDKNEEKRNKKLKI